MGARRSCPNGGASGAGPTAGRLASKTLPTADFMVLVRGVFLKGLGWESFGRTLLALAGYAALFTLLPILGFKKRRR